MIHESERGVENRRGIARMRSLFHPDRRRPCIGTIKRRKVACCAAHVAVGRESRVEEQHSSEHDALLGDRRISSAHVLRQRLKRQRLKNLPRFGKQGGIICGHGRGDDQCRDSTRSNQTYVRHGVLRLGTLPQGSGSTSLVQPGWPSLFKAVLSQPPVGRLRSGAAVIVSSSLSGPSL